ncbi:hypothetical protein V1515DRAFT_580043 [Lipomyces mesembrius]
MSRLVSEIGKSDALYHAYLVFLIVLAVVWQLVFRVPSSGPIYEERAKEKIAIIGAGLVDRQPVTISSDIRIIRMISPFSRRIAISEDAAQQLTCTMTLDGL